MKRTFLAFALSVLLIAALAACSSRPSDDAQNNGSTNSGTSSNGAASRPRPNTNSSGVGSGNSVDEPVGDGIYPESGVTDDVITDVGPVGDDMIDVDPVFRGARSYSLSHHTWDYCADCNGNVLDFGDEATVGNSARRMVNSVTDGARKVGRMVSDMTYGMTHT